MKLNKPSLWGRRPEGADEAERLGMGRGMQKIRYAVAGTGWRAMFYIRAAKRLPEIFELTGVLCRTEEKAEAFEKAHGVKAFASLDTLLEMKPMFVVSCVNKAGMADMVMRLLEAGMPALSETPLAIEMDKLKKLHETQVRTGTALAMAEQYFLYPSHAARINVLKMGILGDVTSCALSAMHDYHGISMLRAYLGEEAGPVTMRARKVASPIVVTGGRGGYVTDGQTGDEFRTFAQIDFGGGRLGLYDFSGTQYHSAIRSNHVRILGTRGEMFDDEVRFLREGNRPAMARFVTHRDEITGTIRAIDFDGERVYENPFRCDVSMDEDEIAVCCVMKRYAEELAGGEKHYSYAFRDSFMAMEMSRLAEEDGAAELAVPDWD